jgi:arylsulfatase A-like enzyme
MLLNSLRRGGLLASLLLIGCSSDVTEPVEEPFALQPAKNLLMICLDTVRADVFYQLGDVQPDLLSPWLDKALVFAQADSTAPWTVPSIGSVFSGLWAQQHGAGQFRGVIREVFKSIPAVMHKEVPVLAQAVAAAGFETSIISASSWTNNRLYRLGLTRGFKDTIKFTTPKHDAVWPAMIAKWQELFTEQTKTSRAFSFLHLMEAHNWHAFPGVNVDERLDGISAEQREHYLQVAPPQACEDQQSEHCRRYLVYASAVMAMREAIAQTLETLSVQGLLDDTVVVVFSDHGEEFGDHRGDGRVTHKSALLPDFGHGGTLYQEQLHVPLLVWHPQLKGEVIADPVSLIDVAPTVARWLAVDFMPDAWGGRFLDDYLNSGQPSVTSKLERVTYASGTTGGGNQFSARKGPRKSIWHIVSDDAYYYDLAVDPHEMNSQATDADILLFDGLFLDYMAYTPKQEIIPGVLSDDQIRRLQSIGYLQGIEVGEDAQTGGD